MSTLTSVRPAAPTDLATIMAIEIAGFAPADQWSADAWTAELTGDRIVLMAGDVGVITWQVVADVADLLRVVVAPQARGRGIGRQLVQAGVVATAERGAERALLEVDADNTAARALYAGFGFAEIDRRRNYYGAGRDAVIMELVLNSKGDGDE